MTRDVYESDKWKYISQIYFFSSFGGYATQLNMKTDSFKGFGGKKALEGMQTIHKVYQYGLRP